MYGNNGNNFAPVKEGEEFDTVVDAVGEKGDGICKKDGFVIFVPGVRQGDNVRVKVTKVLKKVGFGEVVSKLDKAPAKSPEENLDEEPIEEPESEEEVPADYEDFGEEEDLEEEKN